MDELVTWLRGVLDEDERSARAATWTDDQVGNTWRAVKSTAEYERLIVADGFEDGVAIVRPEGLDPEATAEHIALHDPAAVLADIEAKRAILDLHSAVLDGKDRPVCDYCDQLCHSRSGLMCDDPDAPYPCYTVKLLASAYRDRPGYRAEWAPGVEPAE